MLIIQFSGFFQCRLSTDSAPFDSKRGEGGWTIAFGNEPDLDRTIRFHNPAALRSHAPAIDVAVTSVSVDGQPQPAHPLIGGAVDMASDAVFEGRNGTIADASHEPISPMRIQVSAGRLVLSRDAQYDVTRPAQRGPFMGKGLVPLSDPMVRGVRLTSAADALAYRAARRAALTADLTQAPDANAATILQGRIDSLATQNDGAPVATLMLQVPYKHGLSGTLRYDDPDHLLARAPDPAVPWQCSYALGAWDSDTLTGHVHGSLEIPDR